MEQGWWWLVVAQAVLLGCLAVVCFFFFLDGNSGGKHNKAGLPPGPRGLPWLGNLLHFARLRRSELLQDFLNDWTRLYGPLVTVRLGRVPLIFVTGRAEAKELLLAPGGLFDSRPRRASKLCSSNNYRTINSSPYGPRWRELRRNLAVNALSRARVAAMAPVRGAQIQAMVDRLKKHARETPEVPVPVRDHVRLVGVTLLLYIIFGKVMEEKQVRAVNEAVDHLFAAAGPNLADYLPFLRPFISPGFQKRYWAARRMFEDVAAPLVTRIREARTSTEGQHRCYVETLVEEEAKGVVEPADYIVLCSELLTAGDTSTGAMEFALAELVNRPEVQARLAGEIDAVCGGRPLQEQDIESLPYLRAVATETLRRHPPASMTLPHAPKEEGATLRGHAVPRGSELLVCIEQLGMDPEVWEEPHQFVPERFLEGASRTASTDPADMRMIPFGAGRRVCPGMDLALLHLHLIVGRLVQEFEWLPPQDGRIVDVSHARVFTTSLRHPLHARIRLRR